MRHPLARIPNGAPRAIALVALAVATTLLSFKAGGSFNTGPETNQRIVGLELARTSQGAKDLVDQWKRHNQTDAVLECIQWDNVFIVFYSTLLALGCVAVGNAYHSRFEHGLAAAAVMAWLQGLAGALDFVENFAMWHMIEADTVAPWPQLCFGCASTKFALLGAGFLFILLAGTAHQAQLTR